MAQQFTPFSPRVITRSRIKSFPYQFFSPASCLCCRQAVVKKTPCIVQHNTCCTTTNPAERPGRTGLISKTCSKEPAGTSEFLLSELFLRDIRAPAETTKTSYEKIQSTHKNKSRGDCVSVSQPSSVTTTMSSIRTPPDPGR